MTVNGRDDPNHAVLPGARIGVLADTHGRLGASVIEAFAGVEHIIHAGDVGKRSVLRKLQAIAPVTAVAGNTDSSRLAAELPDRVIGEAAGIGFLVTHKPKHLKKLMRNGVPDGVVLIVTGHVHEPSVSWDEGVVTLNPGTATSPEDGDPSPTVAVVCVEGRQLTVTFVPVAMRPEPEKEGPAVTGDGP